MHLHRIKVGKGGQGSLSVYEPNQTMTRKTCPSGINTF